MPQHQRSNRLLALCYLDLDEFKPVNDQYGYDAGDVILVGLGQRLSEMLRKGDTLARLGRDEFAILLTNLSNVHEGEATIQRLLDAVCMPFEVEGHTFTISGSIGTTLYPTDDSSPDTLLRHADQAMYKAKAAGKGGYHIYDTVEDQRLRTHRKTLSEINRALKQREFTLYYQPRVNLTNSQVVGVEALIRWQHPERGLLSPGTFLPFLEGAPEEIALGEWVVRTALEQLNVWELQGITIPISINISPNHIQNKGFAEFLGKELEAYPEGMAEYLELEVLETSAIGEIAQVVDTMNACIDLGVSFSLDDFGTGYSSLTYFHRLPISILKIDQNFVRNMLDDVSDLDIVEGVLRLSESLKRPVVAEGVETVELGLLLLYMGCHYVQGYGIAKPMPANNIPQWMDEWTRDNIWKKLHHEVQDSAEDIELKVAIFSHRRWLNSVNSYILTESSNELPQMDARKCQFGRWYEGMGKSRYGNHPTYAFIPPIHRKVHELADAIVSLATDGKDDLARSRLDELNSTGEQLIGMLRKLPSQ
jgi:diguanylate cyclase (GGDEF)-like protein